MTLEMQEEIKKAKTLYEKMVGSCGPCCFRKIITQAIDEHTLDEFHPVVMKAELTAALTLSHRAQEQSESFNFGEYLHHFFGLQPRHLEGTPVDVIALIMERPVAEVRGILSRFGYRISADDTACCHPFKAQKPSRLNVLRRRTKWA